ncbi:MAG: phosphodiester glycosidase family protein, partial [Verrucomicrobiales bacterium]
DSRTHRLAIVDQPDGPGSRFPDAAAAGRSRNAIASINGGFFTPQGKPLGLTVSNGSSSGYWNTASSLGSAVWHESKSGKSSITRRNSIGKSATLASRDALQTGPLLVENGQPVAGLSTRKSAVRSIILWDGGSRWWLGRTSSCSLASLAKSLAGHSPANWPVQHAVNLDGGLSSDLWISGKIPGGPVTIRPLWNRSVRNFIVLLPR